MGRIPGLCLTGLALFVLTTPGVGQAQQPPAPGPGFGFQGGPPPGPGQNPFGPGPQGIPTPMMLGMMGGGQNMPEMAKRMTAIMALRRINEIGLTAQDIATALPALRNMLGGEHEVQAHAIQVLDEEIHGLLAAQPGSEQPPDSGQRIQETLQTYQQQKNRVWQVLARAIGPDKAGGLRSLVEGAWARWLGERDIGADKAGGLRSLVEGGGIMGPGGPPMGRAGFRFQNGGPGPPPPTGQPGPLGGGFARGAGQGGFGGGAASGYGGSVEGGPGVDTGQQGPPPGAAGQFGGGPPPDTGQGGAAGGFGFQGPPPGIAGPGPGMQGGPFGFGGPHLSLSDLIDLLQQKLMAMRR